MGKLIPIIMLLVGLGAGVGAGIFLKPAHTETDHPEDIASGDDHSVEEPDASQSEDQEDNTDVEYVKMNNQFVVPVVEGGKVKALVVLSLNIEVETGAKEETFQREPKLRSAFNQVLFDHANAGGFDGVFTSSNNMIVLENALFEVAFKIMGSLAKDVLIADIVRQDY